MKFFNPYVIRHSLTIAAFLLFQLQTKAQTLAFPGANGFGRFAVGARGAANPEVYIVNNLNDTGPGSFRDAVSQPGRFIVFSVGGIIRLQSAVAVAANITIAGQTAPGDGIVLFNKRVTFTNSNNTICRFLRIRLGATGNSGQDACGLANGANMIFDHLSVSWGMDEVFSINWDSKNTSPDNITIQNSIIGQALHRENHSAGGLIQTPDGGKVSLIRNLYISNKTRNPKVKGVNEFVNNVVYDWGNGNRLGDILNYGWSGDAYIMGGSAGISEVNIINNYFVGGPLTPPSKTTPFSRGTGTFYLYGAGNYFDNNQDGILNGALVPYDTIGYPGIGTTGFKQQPFPYPMAAPLLSAAQAYQWVIDSVGACYPRRDEVDSLLANEVNSRGVKGWYVYRETDLPFSNGGLGEIYGAPAPADTDADGMPDAWEDAHGLNKNNKQDAVLYSTTFPAYMNIEVYINSLTSVVPSAFIQPNIIAQNITGGSKDINLSIYPNPASQQVAIQFGFKDAGKFQVELYDMQGKSIKMIGSGQTAGNTNHSFNLNVSQYVSGTYMIRITTGKLIRTERLVISGN
ncbi:Por secretion system C-terminal sorting domain-containing protein [Chitinophaga sp. CF118]|uniref:T9SS type A sorting domain-containing protein n=1 Tax=Chitinophaga sp. CF118 TaxID=1884367 RepID=UPI0008EE3570|nr:T9SS type A sorting domain-containing protein [Chitinophaga sp. CF118]SFE52401.1 Por secretion system C-terminal sorting domain-containing protein [Chitinophaga sp. CF118]